MSNRRGRRGSIQICLAAVLVVVSGSVAGLLYARSRGATPAVTSSVPTAPHAGASQAPASASCPAPAGPKVTSADAGRVPRWRIATTELPTLQQLSPDLACAYFNSPSVDLTGNVRSGPLVPSGWSSVPEEHTTAVGACTVNTCRSMSQVIGSGMISPQTVPDVFYDDENWNRTPLSEQLDPCGAMRNAASIATPRGFRLELGPDQNLAELQARQPGESQNWQVDLRSGLAACGAPVAPRYHIMSQAFETPWCKSANDCKGSEADFDNYVIQTWLQAHAANPSVGTTAGLGTNARYNATPQALYQDTLDTQALVGGYWLNVAGQAEPPVGVQYLELVDGEVPLYLSGSSGLTDAFPAQGSAVSTPLLPGQAVSWTTGQVLAPGTVIPAGTHRIETWTSGTSGTLEIEVGLCDAGCAHRTPIIGGGQWTVAVGSAPQGFAFAHSTTSPTTVAQPSGAQLYVSVVNRSLSLLNLNGGTRDQPANIAIPRPSTWVAAPRSSVVVPRGDGSLSAGIGGAGSSQSWNLGTPGQRSFVLAAPAAAGTSIPAGAFLLQTTADGSGAATIGVEIGYCAGVACNGRIPIAAWHAVVHRGHAAIPDAAAFTTSAPTPLPAGDLHLYVTLTVVSPGALVLQLGGSIPTNLATPLTIPA